VDEAGGGDAGVLGMGSVRCCCSLFAWAGYWVGTGADARATWLKAVSGRADACSHADGG